MPDSVARRTFEQLAGGTLPQWPQVAMATQRVRLQAGEALFHTGAAEAAVFVVAEGVLKLVYDTPEGKAWIKGFVPEGRFFASITALAPGGRTSFSALAAVPTVVERLPYALLESLGEAHADWQRLLLRAFRFYGESKEKRERELLTLSAEARYQRFCEDHPTLEPRLKQQDVAGYIRITPVALSRIRARLKRAGRGGAAPA